MPKSMQSNLLLTPLYLKLNQIQGLFQGKMELKDIIFKDSPLNSRTFQDCANPGPISWGLTQQDWHFHHIPPVAVP